MNCKILLPSEVFFNKEVAKVVAEADNGRFCLLPQHIDFVASLVPGVLIIVSTEGTGGVLCNRPGCPDQDGRQCHGVHEECPSDS